MPGGLRASQCRVARQVRVRRERGADAMQKWARGSENNGQPRPHPRFLGMQRPRVLSCMRRGARAGKERSRTPYRESSKKRTVAREVAKVEALCREYVRSPGRTEGCLRRPGRSSRYGTNSIGGFSFGLHGYGGLSCNGDPCDGAGGGGGVLPCVRAGNISAAAWLDTGVCVCVCV
jgi:hypothetical protein